VLQAGTGEGEGTAMLEIVHDLAPGAGLAFYGPTTSGDMIAGMNALAAAGATVIVDDLTFFDQPNFEEGPIAQTVNTLVAQGVVYATSSGNFADGNSDRGHYEAQYVDGGAITGLTGTVHAFGPGENSQSIVVLPGGHPRIFLQWGDPFGQAGDDYDLYVVDGGGNVIASGTDAQDGNDVPLEGITLDTTGIGAPVQLFVIVNLFAGSPRRIELYYAGGVTAIAHATPAGSIAGHANASGAITVATINAGDPNNDDIAPYSSQGPCDLLFPNAETRAKPDVTGIDGVAVTGAAGFSNPFFGTSAAAPHVAAVAALMRQAAPSLTAPQVKNALMSSAVDLGAAGFDTLFGAGRVDAVQAVGAAAAAVTTPPTITFLSAVLDGTTLTLQATATDPDADITTWVVSLVDGSGQTLGSTNVAQLSGVAGQTNPSFTLTVTGVDGGFATAVQAALVLGDSAQHSSAEVRADFSQADSGGPQIVSAAFSKRGRKLKITGAGLVRRATRVEINGATFTGKANRRGNKAIAKGSARRLGLQSGANRIRALVNGARSNILILTH
jgi:subtilisin family serine protease